MCKAALSLSLFLVFFGTLHSQSIAPSVIWQKNIGGSNDEQVFSIVKTADGGFLIAGETKSNDGDISGHHGPTTNTDALAMKISADGNIVWQKSFGGSESDYFKNLVILPNGHIVFFGMTTSTDGDVIGNHGSSDVWLVETDGSGNMEWQKTMGGSGSEGPGNILLRKNGNLVFIGSAGANDGDVSGVNGEQDVWIVELTTSGSVLSSNTYGGRIIDEGKDIKELPDGRFILIADYNSNDGDFNPEGYTGPWLPGVAVIFDNTLTTIENIQRYYDARGIQLISLSDTMTIFSQGRSPCYPGTGTPAIQFSTAYRIYPGGQPYYGVGQYGPQFSFCNWGQENGGYRVWGPTSMTMLNANTAVIAAATDDSVANQFWHGGFLDGFISAMAISGTGMVPQWRILLGGAGFDAFTCIETLDNGDIVAAGFSNSTDGLFSTNHGGNDLWIVKLGNTNRVTGTVFQDYNRNGIREATEPFADNLLVETRKNNLSSASLTTQGWFSNLADTGLNTSSIVTTIPYNETVPVSHNSVFGNYGLTDTIQFAIQPIPGKRDYSVHLFLVDEIRPGFDVNMQIAFRNIGTDTLTDRIVKFIGDPRLLFQSALPAPTAIHGDTLIWQIGRLVPRADSMINILFKGDVPPVLNMDDTMTLKASIDSAGDLAPINNLSVLRGTVIGAFDPNDKKEAGDGILYNELYQRGQTLTYTIRFQNLGTDTAFNIVVRDTLDASLDISSLEMIGASHNYSLNIKDGKYCTWTFSNIKLPQEAVDEKGSHGYITYSIRPVAGLPLQSVINNSAAIYFDFNLPVLTNLQTTKIEPLPVSPIPVPKITGIDTSYCGNQGVVTGHITNYSDTEADILVKATLGQQTVPVAENGEFSIDMKTLTPGDYVFTVVFTGPLGSQQSSQEFSIQHPVVVKNDLISSASQISPTSSPVTISALAEGVGDHPLYTFASDRLFTQILQGESASSSMQLSSGRLQNGINWIYGRVKTSSTCYDQLQAIDSVSVTLTSQGGLIDPDDPLVHIKVSPNPFRSKIIISGFNPAKEYRISLTNISGQTMLTQTVKGSARQEITPSHTATGTYWLTIYADGTRKLGSIKLMSQ